MQREIGEALAFEVNAVRSRVPFGRVEHKLWRVLLHHAVQLQLVTSDDILTISMQRSTGYIGKIRPGLVGWMGQASCSGTSRPCCTAACPSPRDNVTTSSSFVIPDGI